MIIRRPRKSIYGLTPVWLKIAYYYTLGARRPWSGGYLSYKFRFIKKTLRNKSVLDAFRNSGALPRGYGRSLDERVIEYPWVLSRIPIAPNGNFLDVGSTLNYKVILNLEAFRNKKITILNLSPEENRFNNVSYMVGDIRNLPFDNNSFDFITCISTLEHVGLDNTRYTSRSENLESRPRDFERAVSELKRAARPSAKVFITVPFGKYKNFGWFQQFDIAMIQQIIKTFHPSNYQINYYKYTHGGWNISNEVSSKDAEYSEAYNGKMSADRAAGARAVACLELTK